MNRTVCIVPVAPMRREGSHKSEITSQLLFGETAEILETSGDFIRIRASYDNYEGWCQRVQFTSFPDAAEPVPSLLTAGWLNTVQFNGQTMYVPRGSNIGLVQKYGKIGQFTCSYSGEVHKSNAAFPGTIGGFAKQYLNTPYLWGGRSVFGIDCSGFVQQVYQFFNQKLPRDAYQQAETGTHVGFLEEAREGDLAYFDNEDGRIIHVGILLTPNTIIHASGRVRIDPIDNMGIVSSDTGERTHKLRMIKRGF